MLRRVRWRRRRHRLLRADDPDFRGPLDRRPDLGLRLGLPGRTEAIAAPSRKLADQNSVTGNGRTSTTSAGTYTPKLRVKRGATEEHTFTHRRSASFGHPRPAYRRRRRRPTATAAMALQIAAACQRLRPPSPSCRSRDPPAASTNASYTFTANGVELHAGGERLELVARRQRAPSTTNSISIQWTTAGTKSISVETAAAPARATITAVDVIGRRHSARRRLHHPGERPHGELQRHLVDRGRRPRILWNFGDGQTGTGMTVAAHLRRPPGPTPSFCRCRGRIRAAPSGSAAPTKSSVVQVGGGSATPTPTPRRPATASARPTPTPSARSTATSRSR